MAEQRDYRLVLVLSGSRTILAAENAGRTELPRVSVSVGERSVEQLNRIMTERWGISTVVLDIALCNLTGTPCAFLEVRNRARGTQVDGLQPIRLDALPPGIMSDDETILLSDLWSHESSSNGVFTRIGWLDAVQQWIQASVSDRHLSFNGDVRQLNAGSGFELCRLGVHDGPAYWVKGVGAPNLREFGITKALAKCVPRYLPPIIAMREEWNAWVMEEAGLPLEEDFTLPRVQQAVQALAELQLDSIPHIERLRRGGCSDCTLLELDAHLSEIREFLQEAMGRQTSTKVTPLDRERLVELEAILREACFKMQELDIPDALIHNDINFGNILVSDNRCFFIDWAETQIGNPFLAFQHICAQVTRNVSEADVWLHVMRRTYRERWQNWLSVSQINKAFALMPILAIASYLFGRGNWLDSSSRDDPQFQPYARSLARYIDRAARAPELEEALCH
jgi:hypothetical protein